MAVPWNVTLCNVTLWNVTPGNVTWIQLAVAHPVTRAAHFIAPLLRGNPSDAHVANIEGTQARRGNKTIWTCFAFCPCRTDRHPRHGAGSRQSPGAKSE